VRREYFPRQAILEEVKQALLAYQPGQIDWVTFVGSGEPTLYEGLGWLVRCVRDLTSLPIAIITNGSLLYLPEIRRQIATADAILPSLDAGNSKLYRKINRPYPKLSFESLLEGLVDLRKEYPGQFWLEVMLVKGLNDTREALQEIARAIEQIRPHQVHVMLPERPPAEAWVQVPDEAGLQRARETLGEVANLIIPAHRSATSCSQDELMSAVIGIITRHPMREAELCSIVGDWSQLDVQRALESLCAQGKAQRIMRHGESFWSASRAFYPIEKPSSGDGNYKS
jgi:wyosine [tRNA(Phe)-imidazoG37] synthetase (radical SAM superfamily)